MPVHSAPHCGDDPTRRVQFTVTLSLGGHMPAAEPCGRPAWHASVRLPDASVYEFASPFELVRFLSRPLPVETRGRTTGLR